mmetsp:Transcript_32246/g.48349  ORF Transcript_32246/g.48349 Transcript_32246/m.48349 type:complete len:308 (+) Transcript_32246:73-996(+)
MIGVSVGQKRKAEENLPSPPLNELEPLEQVSKAREDLGELLISDKKNAAINFDIEQNIREIRAILQMNAEILDRCTKFMTHTSDKSTTFARIRFEVVQVRKMKMIGTQFITRPIRETSSFDTTSLSFLPQELDDIIVKHNMAEGKLKYFIDFEKFFNKSLILHESVLEPFLPKLKEHLMTIQVCLGGIDSWVIREPQVAISFLEATFSTKMEIPGHSVELRPHICKCDADAHDRNLLCLSCGEAYGSHYYDGACSEGCDYGSREFTCEVFQVLKHCKVKGKYETSFDITNVQEQARLKKFLEFISIE